LPYLLSGVAGIAITATVWLLRRRRPAGLAIWAFYLVMLAPVAGIVHTGYHLGADRVTYVPGMGFALLVGALAVTVVLAWRRGVLRTPIVAMALGVGAIWIGGLALNARVQSFVWHDSETIWRYAIEVDPGCAICHHNLGVILGTRGDWADAQVLLERAIALRPDRSEFHGGYGPLLIQMDRRPEGVTKLRYRLADNPRDVNARVNLWIALIEEPARRGDRRRRACAAPQAGLRAGPECPRPGAPRRRPRGARAGRQQLPVLDRLDPKIARMLEQEIPWAG
jgi:hypothetical protein